MSGFLQLDIGSLLIGVAGFVVTAKIASIGRDYSKNKQLREWKMPLYQELIDTLAGIDESILALLGSAQIPYGSRDYRGVKMDIKEVRRENKKLDAQGVRAIESFRELREKASAIRLKLLSVDDKDVDRDLRWLLDVFDAFRLLNSDRFYWIQYYDWASQMRNASLSVIQSMRKQMGLDYSDETVRPNRGPYANFEELCNTLEQYEPELSVSLTTAQKKALLNGEVLALEDHYLAWFKVHGYIGILAGSQLNELVRVKPTR